MWLVGMTRSVRPNRKTGENYLPMQEPGTCVVCYEADGDVVRWVITDGYNIPTDGVLVVVCATAGTANHSESVLHTVVRNSMTMHGKI